MPIDVLYLNDKYYIAFKFLFIAIDVKPTHTYDLPKFNKGGKQRFSLPCALKSSCFFSPGARSCPAGGAELCRCGRQRGRGLSPRSGVRQGRAEPPTRAGPHPKNAPRRVRAGQAGAERAWEKVWELLPWAQLARPAPEGTAGQPERGSLPGHVVTGRGVGALNPKRGDLA